MAEDISKKTIVVLVMLAIVVSALGTLTVLDSVSNAHVKSVPAIHERATTEASGFVSLKVKKPVKVTGNVILNLVKE